MPPVKLVTKPTVAETAKKEVLELAQELLGDAKSGDVVEVFMVIKHPDGTWSHRRSSNVDTPALIGRLEIAKQSAVYKYLNKDD